MIFKILTGIINYTCKKYRITKCKYYDTNEVHNTDI